MDTLELLFNYLKSTHTHICVHVCAHIEIFLLLKQAHAVFLGILNVEVQ